MAKAKGPIRVEAVVPFLIVTALIAAYFILFFDRQLKAGIEWAGTQANGAEVNVGRLRTSFLGGWIRIGEIEVTNPLEPAKNRVKIGEVRLGLLWDALLRAKFVVDDAAIENIELGTPRKSPGLVLPPPAEDGKPSRLAQLKQEVSRAVLGEAGQLLEGLDPSTKLKDLGKLKSAERVTQLKSELQKKEGEWGAALAALPGEKDFSALQAKVNALQGGGNPAEIASKIAQANELLKEVDSKATALKVQGENLTRDVNAFSGAIGQLDELARQDRLELEKMLSIPSLDAKDLARQLFGASILDKIGQAQGYATMARKYMPVRASGAKGAPVAIEEKPARAKGKTFEFGRPNSYPLFWLKRATISSKGAYSAFAGDISGKLTDVTSSPSQIGRPAVLSLEGEFPKLDIRGVTATVEIDHTREVAVERLKATVRSFPVLERSISESPDLKFAIAKAQGSSGIEAMVTGDRFRLALDGAFSRAEYRVAAKSRTLESLLQGVVRDVPSVTLNAVAEGTWSDFGLSVQSNLAGALQAGLQRQLQAKLMEARRKIDEKVQASISQGRAELMQRYNDQRNRFTSQLEDRRKKVDAMRGQAMAKLNSVKSQGASVQQKAVDQIKRKLPFGR
ncbi:MAG: TIGR03545 family protein [Oligoflexia bacterium]|nr:TIGR03545 family protein [Oligoflexia bacterium]